MYIISTFVTSHDLTLSLKDRKSQTVIVYNKNILK